MKRLHLHIVVENLQEAIRFYSDLFDTSPCCGGSRQANWRIEDPPLNLAATVTSRPTGLAHFGLEVENATALAVIDGVLRAPSHASQAVPWEVSVRKQPVRKELGP